MTEPTPGIPKKGNTLPLLLLSVVLIVGAGLLFYLKPQGTATVQQSPKAPALPAIEAEPELAFAPPPPPPPPEVKAKAGASTTQTNATPPSAQAGRKTEAKAKPKAPAACPKNCSGSASSALKSALRAQGAQARSCYQNALRQNAELAGSLLVNLQLKDDGHACSVSLIKDTIGDAGVRSCILSHFRSGAYPAPKGGCISINLPLNFSAK